MSRRKKMPRVELLNVPCYRQGTFDSLCAYYTAAMMLSTLFPDYGRRFGVAARKRATRNLSDDPLIKNYSKSEDHRLILVRWFYQGERVRKATTVLNNTMRVERHRARFVCTRETAHDNTFDKVIAGSINVGLPVMLGWNTPDYGDHAVLVTGYWEDHERWLLVNDPGGDSFQISWDSLTRQKREKFQVGLCKPNSHVGYRPMMSKETADGSAATVYRWTDDGYKPVDDDFKCSS